MDTALVNRASPLFFNRELSWIDFNARVLEEALRSDLPPLERLRFVAIASSNLDEFFMVRMAALKRAARHSPGEKDEAETAAAARDLGPRETLGAAAVKIRSLLARLYACLNGEILPALEKGGMLFLRPPFQEAEEEYLHSFFLREAAPVLTPLRLEEEAPQIANGRVYGAFLLRPTHAADVPVSAAPVAVVEIPPVLDRVVRLESSGTVLRWALLDDLLLCWGGAFFPGYHVVESMIFRVHRDADFSVDERRDEDFIEAMEEVLAGREKSRAVRMAYSAEGVLKERLAASLKLEAEDLYFVDGPLSLASFWSLLKVEGFDKLKARPLRHYPHPAFSADESIFDTLRKGDVLLTLPYHSFDPVVRFFEEAASDPRVVSIKTALYRTSGDSPVIRALEQAALNGKHVTAVVELKARFDEERNIIWANRLERAGVIVVYGLARLKVHAKTSQIIRREQGGLRRYIHLSTGNYNDKTARLYSDLSLFTVQDEIGADVTQIFNLLTAYSNLASMKKLVLAPTALKTKLLDLINREAKRAREGAPGKIMAKMNALVDRDMIEALYRASREGVKILLNVRGICTAVPGVPGLSENIRVVSIVGHYLEHSRIIYCNNGGAEEVFISSSDWMPRNLERRVELLIPLLDEKIKSEVKEILESYFKDNVQSWMLESSGVWKRLGAEGGELFEVQKYLSKRAAREEPRPQNEFVVRRRQPPER
ncbi:MAG: polyphosphate kinase 1 [Treponema sp.]|nr:polyphosphate kinase 1 [Treponema sp.]